MTEHEEFVRHHIEALLARDLDRVMPDYHHDVVLRAGGHEHRGINAVRVHLEAALASSPDDSRLDYRIEAHADGAVTLHWELFAPPNDQPVMRGHDTYHLRDRRIATQEVVIDVT